MAYEYVRAPFGSLNRKEMG